MSRAFTATQSYGRREAARALKTLTVQRSKAETRATGTVARSDAQVGESAHRPRTRAGHVQGARTYLYDDEGHLDWAFTTPDTH
ncbi:MAG: hypothetical protein ACSLE6_07305 [Mycobacterium sp.]